ncbi:MAG TPA: hypothetical protein VN426_02615 [Syntrophomonadaceae bacterium]|nr:hypothetical protein [Syntrophomonadaceae bacterium]
MLKDLFSIEKKRMSALIAGFFITLIISLSIYYMGDISSNLGNTRPALLLVVEESGSLEVQQMRGQAGNQEN